MLILRKYMLTYLGDTFTLLLKGLLKKEGIYTHKERKNKYGKRVMKTGESRLRVMPERAYFSIGF